MTTEPLPSLADVRAAAARIAPHAVRTPVLRNPELDALLGAEIHFKCENLQRGGAFKFRGACNAVFSLDEATARRGIVTQSSGNHGTAIAIAARAACPPTWWCRATRRRSNSRRCASTVPT
jgi:threonine dehydratase